MDCRVGNGSRQNLQSAEFTKVNGYAGTTDLAWFHKLHSFGDRELLRVPRLNAAVETLVLVVYANWRDSLPLYPVRKKPQVLGLISSSAQQANHSPI
jgi:hypothetical protein